MSSNAVSSDRQPMPMTEADAAEHLKEKHLQMIMDAKQAGRKIPAVGINPDVVGEELARTSVEASERTMRRAERRSFLIPEMPWLRARGK